MPIDKRAPTKQWSLEFKIEPIANGHIITARAQPNKDDPYGEGPRTRAKAGPWYIRELEEAPEMVQHMLDQIQMVESTDAAFKEE